MSDPGPDLDINPLALPADWMYQIGQRFLTAAKACGLNCPRSFIIDQDEPPGLCCDPCQLIVQVRGELRKWPGNPCCMRYIGHVTVMLDTCLVIATNEGDYDIDAVNANAQLVLGQQGAIMQGIMRTLAGNAPGYDFQASLTDPMPLSCRNVDGGVWRLTATESNCARWSINFTVYL